MRAETAGSLAAAGAAFLEEKGVENARLDARLLLCHLQGWSRTELALRRQEIIPGEVCREYRRLLERRGAGEPLQYITGVQSFMGLPFHVEEGVLIPRPETELLVEKALRILKSHSGPEEKTGESLRILDIGCGSGAIGVSLAVLLPGTKVTCTDISHRALAIARSNAEALGAEVEFLQGDLLEPVKDRRFDMILSNPPYIAEEVREELAGEVREHEPAEALFGGKDGLAVYRRLIPAAGPGLYPGGTLLLEIGWDQKEAVEGLLAETGEYSRINGFRDFAGRDRILLAEKTRAGSSPEVREI